MFLGLVRSCSKQYLHGFLPPPTLPTPPHHPPPIQPTPRYAGLKLTEIIVYNCLIFQSSQLEGYHANVNKM